MSLDLAVFALGVLVTLLVAAGAFLAFYSPAYREEGRRDGVSWTPETALFALTAAGIGESDVAAGWLGWLDMHRTAAGSLSEKVQANGQPAAVAPLAWTAALVVLTVESQDQKPPILVTTG